VAILLLRGGFEDAAQQRRLSITPGSDEPERMAALRKGK
jgi:hypothetical protein